MVGKVRQGEKYTVESRSGDWFKILLDSGREGWIFRSLADFSAKEGKETEVVGVRRDLPSLVQRISQSVFLIYGQDKKGKLVSKGTGFFVHRNGRLVTNFHVIKGVKNLKVKLFDGQFLRVSRSLAEDRGADLVLLDVSTQGRPVKPLALALAGSIRIGERIVVIGGPLGLQGSVSDGLISAMRKLPRYGTLLQITAPISPGSSGSPVLNLNGEVVGIATLSLKGGQNVNFAVSADKLRRLQSESLKGIAKSLKKTTAGYRKAALQGNARAQANLGFMYANGRGVAQDAVQAVKWYRKAALQGNALGQNNLGFMYGAGLGVTQDHVQAVKWYSKAALQGNARAQSNLGFAYAKGLGVAQDYTQALEWYRKAALQGHASAQSNLGFMYRTGLGVTQDHVQAVKWYSKAALQGYASAQTVLGLMYAKGLGVAQDDVQAVRWYRKAALQGDASAQYNLGIMYRTGRGVAQDYTQAVKWYRKAVLQGYASAQSNLGFMYAKGLGVAQDDVQAVKWYRKAALQGNALGQNNLGFMYETGRGVTQDHVQAVKWYSKAAL